MHLKFWLANDAKKEMTPKAFELSSKYLLSMWNGVPISAFVEGEYDQVVLERSMLKFLKYYFKFVHGIKFKK